MDKYLIGEGKAIYQGYGPIIIGIDTETGLAVSCDIAKRFLDLDTLYKIKDLVDKSIGYWEKSGDNPDDINLVINDLSCRGANKGPNKVTATKSVFVYIMHDTKTGAYKIGISSNPKYRESTLQSEKPSIELIWKSDSLIKNAKKLETKIHEHFSLNRIRGEWFELDSEDIETIKNFCKSWTN